MIWQADLIDCWSRHHSFSSLLIEIICAPRQPSSGAAGPGRVSGLYEQALAMPSILFLSSASEG